MPFARALAQHFLQNLCQVCLLIVCKAVAENYKYREFIKSSGNLMSASLVKRPLLVSLILLGYFHISSLVLNKVKLSNWLINSSEVQCLKIKNQKVIPYLASTIHISHTPQWKKKNFDKLQLILKDENTKRNRYFYFQKIY